MTKPDAIYFDTNILYKFYPKFDSFELKRLVSLCNTLNISLFITEIVLRELSNLCHEDLNKTTKTTEYNINFLQALGIQPLYTENDLLKIHEFDVQSFLIKKLESLNIIVVPISDIPLQKLIHMSIEHIAPFEKKDKGFKDALIMFGVLNHSQKAGFKIVLLVTKDKIFLDKNIEKIASEYKCQLLIDNKILETIDRLNQTLQRDFREYMAGKQSEIMKFLETQLPAIKAYMEKAGFAEEFFRKSKKFPLNASLIKIIDMDVSGIKKVIYVGEKGTNNKKKIEIIFIVDTVFRLLVKIIHFGRIFGPYHYLESSGWDASKDRESEARIEQIEIRIGADISASVQFEEPDKYSYLEIKEQTPYFI